MSNISKYTSLITITDAIPPNFCKYIAGNIYSRIINSQLSTHSSHYNTFEKFFLLILLWIDINSKFSYLLSFSTN